MKMQNFYEELRKEFSNSDQEYCNYCNEDRIGMTCCGENHWVLFEFLEKDTQDAIIKAEFDRVYGVKK
jgi:hypothetical protein